MSCGLPVSNGIKRSHVKKFDIARFVNHQSAVSVIWLAYWLKKLRNGEIGSKLRNYLEIDYYAKIVDSLLSSITPVLTYKINWKREKFQWYFSHAWDFFCIWTKIWLHKMNNLKHDLLVHWLTLQGSTKKAQTMWKN